MGIKAQQKIYKNPESKQQTINFRSKKKIVRKLFKERSVLRQEYKFVELSGEYPES